MPDRREPVERGQPLRDVGMRGRRRAVVEHQVTRDDGARQAIDDRKVGGAVPGQRIEIEPAIAEQLVILGQDPARRDELGAAQGG